MKKIALITGITGRDGSYLAEFLLEKIMKYTALKEDHHHLIPQELTISTKIHKTKNNFILHFGDLTDSLSIVNLVKKLILMRFII